MRNNSQVVLAAQAAQAALAYRAARRQHRQAALAYRAARRQHRQAARTAQPFNAYLRALAAFAAAHRTPRQAYAIWHR